MVLRNTRKAEEMAFNYLNITCRNMSRKQVSMAAFMMRNCKMDQKELILNHLFNQMLLRSQKMQKRSQIRDQNLSYISNNEGTHTATFSNVKQRRRSQRKIRSSKSKKLRTNADNVAKELFPCNRSEEVKTNVINTRHNVHHSAKQHKIKLETPKRPNAPAQYRYKPRKLVFATPLKPKSATPKSSLWKRVICRQFIQSCQIKLYKHNRHLNHAKTV